MKRAGLLSKPKFWITLISAVLVCVFVLGDVGRSSPGPLASVHARVSKLTGFGSCSQCHGRFTTGMAESCLACHEDVGAQFEKKSGLHGKLPEANGQQCSMCHSDHNGAGFSMINARSFALAGVPDRKMFDHALIGFPMEGRHSELECSTCHEHADTLVLPEGGKRFLGLAQNCATCHEDAHQGRMVTGCATCHSQHSFERLASKGHDRHLPLIGGHAQTGCRECHAKDTPHSLEVLGSQRSRQPRQCADCHKSPHAQTFVAAIAKGAGKPAAASCVTCHASDHTSFRDERLLITKQHHAASGVPLDAPHDKASCVDCHGADDADFAKRHPGRGPNDCRQCHKDPHGGQFDNSNLATQGCVTCHDRQHFAPHAFTVEAHAKTAFPLTGTHAKTDCKKCHELPGTEQPRKFHGTTLECGKCHGDAHAGFFENFRGELAVTKNGSCAACHGTTSFSDLPKKGFDHGHFTGFQILGAHAQIECKECHVHSKEPDEFGRTFGRVVKQHPEIRKGGESCGACHADPHRGDFDKTGNPTTFEERKGCERCHTHESFRALRKGFDHGLWTGFDIGGAHAKASCSDCHAPLRRPDEHGRTWSRAKGKQCADCHADPHAGQFKETPSAKTDCARCHRAAKDFKDLVFHHELHSRFPLGDRHKGVACSKCHKVEKGGEQVVRYRPKSRECADCHGKQQDPFRRRQKE